MSERPTAGTEPDDLSDRGVRKAFRALSTETAPARLDREVLNEASGAASATGLRRYYRMKPLAWAAILVLTVGIVLELKRADEPPPPAIIDENEMARRLGDEPNAVGAESLRDQPLAEPTASRAGKQTAADTAAAPTRSKADADGVRPAPGSDPIRATRRAIEAAEELAGERDQNPGQSIGLAPRSLERAETREQRERYCSEAQTADASSWYQCILELEKQGKTEQAIEERSRLATEFPEFELR